MSLRGKKTSLPDTKAFYMGGSMIKMNDSTLLALGSRFNSTNLFSTIALNVEAKSMIYFPLF